MNDGGGAHSACRLGAGAFVAAGATYAFAPPIIHLTRDRLQPAAASFIMRVAFPSVGIVAGIAMTDNDSSDLETTLGIGVIVSTFVIPMLLDWLVLAVPATDQQTRRATDDLALEIDGGP